MLTGLGSVDNSESMRNGDYLPSRFEGQADCVNLLANAKTSQNPESTVGLISMAGKRVEVLQTLAQDPTDVLSALHKVQIAGEADLAAGLEVAQLALKHRGNKNGGQRVVVFVGSPIKEDAKTLTRLGKKLKKSDISLDIVSLGEDSDNDERIKALLDAVQKNGLSHWVHVPAGSGLIADVLVSSPIFFGGEGGDEDAAAVAAAGAAAGGAAGGAARPLMGVDRNVDPDLYEAIQMSLREDEERNAAAAAAAAAAAGGGSGGAPATPAARGNSNNNAAAPSAPSKSQQPGGVAPMDLGDDMDEEMRSAIALSMQMQGGGGDELYKDLPPLHKEESASLLQHDDNKEDAEAMRLSMQLAEQSQKEDAVKAALNNEDYVKSLFGDLPVDLDDASIQAALESITKGSAAAPKEEGKQPDPKKKKDADK